MGKRKRGQGNDVEDDVKRMRLKEHKPNTGVNLDVNAEDSETKNNNKTANFVNKMMMRVNGHVGISYKEAKRIIATDANCSLVAVIEKRHVTVGWHQLGKATDAINYIVRSSLGHYRDSLNGVLLAIGKITVIDKPLCIADQPCMHIDLKINSIVFRPKSGQVYKCIVIAVDKKFVTAKLYNTITFFAPLKNIKKRINVEEEISIKFSCIEVKGPLCQMKGTVVY